MDTNVLDNAQRARLVAAMPSGSDTGVTEILLERCNTLAEAERILRHVTPTFPLPQAVPLPTWVNENGSWGWDADERSWSRPVARAGASGFAIGAFQVVKEDGELAELSAPSLLPASDDEVAGVTPQQLADLGQWLIDVAAILDSTEA
ncbi:hypothetical protein C8K30_10545 [Promicromonospora sp. AC04]|uniref:hypothetical protein n=1 Tax=Promicromonospora sp. AC04 TaxID=2135723 RepID=UPI000D33CC8B|nr:hypothetical protein [Promicromonospora sp. AC04]PUB26818.1 hypothetical protein C8K30_10545 [Promicromonospora sp. AC04]